MPNIRPISDLKNYVDVLKDISVDTPVFLTKNGRGRYAIVDIEDYEKTQAFIKLMSKLNEAEQAAGKDGWIDADNVKSILGVE
jgi:prevent-host-death family protein